MRAALKSTAELVLARGGAARIARSLRRRQAVVLTYHNIRPDGASSAGDASLHLPRRAFIEQVEALRSTHEIVPLDALLEPVSDSRARPRAAITFDDTYRGAVTIGVDELQKRGIPATMFVAPGCLGDQTFWWDRLAVPSLGEIEPAVRHRALHQLAGQGHRIEAPAIGMPGSDMRSATESEIHEALARHPGLSVGSHSWSHPNLAALGAAELSEELDRPLAWLRQRFARATPWVSYPYGCFSDTVRAAAERAGYRGGVTLASGWVGPDAVDPFAIPRLNVPAGLSLDGFVARIAGVI